MTDLQDLLSWMRSDLKTIHSGSQWCAGMGYSKAGKGLDAPRGLSLAKTEEDEAKGATYDLGLGDHAARAALHNVAGRLVRAEMRMNGAWVACGRTRQVLTTLNLAQPGSVRTITGIEQSLLVLNTLLDLIERDSEHVNEAFTQRRVFKSTGKGYDQLRFAVGGLERALNRGEEAEPSAKECVNAGCKNISDVRETQNGKAGMREGGLCSACARFRRRNGFLPSGHRIHRELDRQPWAMQNKRRANGMDNGDESLSWALKVVDE